MVQEHGAGEVPSPCRSCDARDDAARRDRPLRPGRGRSAAVRGAPPSPGGHGLAATLAEPPPARPFVGLVVANEVLDALPVHRVRRRGDRLVEIALTVDPTGAFAETEIAPTTPALAARLAAEGIALVDGQTAEICLALDAWVTEAATALERGVLLLIDYGAPAAELYDPSGGETGRCARTSDNRSTPILAMSAARTSPRTST